MIPPDLARLAQVPLFKGLSESELQSLLPSAAARRLTADEYFFFQGDPADRLFVLIAGRVKILQASPDGQQVLLRVVTPYQLFGAVALAQNELFPATAQAAEDCAALVWTKTTLMENVLKYPQMALNTIQLMSSHIQEFQERFRQLATERVERRLARTLLRLASQTGKKIPEGVLIDMPLTRQDLAEMIGTTLFTVSRLLKQWDEQGLVISKRERVIIRYPHGLVNVAEDLPFTPPGAA